MSRSIEDIIDAWRDAGTGTLKTRIGSPIKNEEEVKKWLRTMEDFKRRAISPPAKKKPIEETNFLDELNKL
jgi:hypothetical protein